MTKRAAFISSLNPFLIREVVLTKKDLCLTIEEGLNPFLIREVVLTLMKYKIPLTQSSLNPFLIREVVLTERQPDSIGKI